MQLVNQPQSVPFYYSTKIQKTKEIIGPDAVILGSCGLGMALIATDTFKRKV
jgi:hypothetical protein